MLVRIVNYSDTHTIGVIQTRKGYEYGCVFAKEYSEDGTLFYPTKDDVKQAWKEDKRDFTPYTHFNLGIGGI